MSKAIRFLLGAEKRTLRDIDPTMTVLDYLRLNEGRCGTKEGCAEGDCGACTVVLGERVASGAIQYRSVNSCIQFVPTLNGKHLVTIEDIRLSDGSLHPVQEAMVKTHASQCGFCTPGFVMSLYVRYLQEGRPDRLEIDDILAGNLCRCTGYRPIIEAARQMFDLPRPSPMPCEDIGRLQAHLAAADGKCLSYRARSKRYFAPESADELADHLIDHPDATILAGGTDIGLWVTKQHRELETIIYVGDVKDLRTPEVTRKGLEIPCAATYSQVHDLLGRHYPDLGEIVRRLGSTQIRNIGTVCGNIANGSPIGDMPPALIALGATLVLRKGSERREIDLEDFFVSYGQQDLQPGEFVERVILPLRTEVVFRSYKISKRFDQDISAVCGAFCMNLDQENNLREVRICYGGMAPVPKRASHAESMLLGKRWSKDNVERAMDAMDRDYTPISDMRASAPYRMTVAKNLLYKCFIESRSPGYPTRLAGQAGHTIITGV